MLEKICTDLETSKKLKELGIEMATPFYWRVCDDGSIDYIFMRSEMATVKQPKAYTLEQILEMLPFCFVELEGTGHELDKICYVTFDRSNVRVIKNKKTHQGLSMRKAIDGNLATTAARLLIKLIEDKIITNPNNKESDE